MESGRQRQGWYTGCAFCSMVRAGRISQPGALLMRLRHNLIDCRKGVHEKVRGTEQARFCGGGCGMSGYGMGW